MRRLAPVVAGFAIVLSSACVPASPDENTYEQKTSTTLGAAVSELATTAINLEQLAQGRIFRPAVLTQLRYSEDNLGTATKSLTELNPPVAADRLHRRSVTLLGDAEDLLATSRIAVHRRQQGRYVDLVGELRSLADDLEALEKQASS